MAMTRRNNDSDNDNGNGMTTADMVELSNNSSQRQAHRGECQAATHKVHATKSESANWQHKQTLFSKANLCWQFALHFVTCSS